jgi:hypothetical protein
MKAIVLSGPNEFSLQEIAKQELKGICAALCTPSTEDGEKVDETGIKKPMKVLSNG